MHMPLKLIPQPFIDQYNLQAKTKNGNVYIEIQKGMYGLPQAGILANKLLKQRLSDDRYHKQPHTPGGCSGMKENTSTLLLWWMV